MRKTAIAMLVLCCFFSSTIASASMLLEYDGGIHNYTGSIYSLSVNGKTLTNLPLSPIIFNDRALVPVREVFEALGATVNYVSSDKSTNIIYGKNKVGIKIGSDTASVNGEKKTIPDNATPRLIAKWGESAKTMVPVRFISENVGLTVNFDAKSGLISVADKNAPTATASPSPTPTVKPAATFNKISYKQSDDVVTVTVSANGSISKITKATLTTSGVLYVDVSGTSYTAPNKTEINAGPVVAVRLGLHENSTRIAIDTKDVKKYTAGISQDGKSVVFQITSNSSAQLSTPAPTKTPAATEKPTQTPTSQPTQTPAPTRRPSSIAGTKIVVIDAGHGGSDPGASGYLMTDEELEVYHDALNSTEPVISEMEAGTGKKYNEKDIALTVAKKVEANLKANGITVIMTRSGDTYPTLDERPELANKNGAVLFFSIHLNSSSTPVTSASGIEIYYSEQNNDDYYGITSKESASMILKEVINATGAKSRGVKSGNLLVNRKCVMPSNLLEIGFMNNPDELEKMASDSYQTKLASGISKGIISVLAKEKLR